MQICRGVKKHNLNGLFFQQRLLSKVRYTNEINVAVNDVTICSFVFRGIPVEIRIVIFISW